MDWFYNLKTGTKLIISFGLFIIILVAVIGLSLSSISTFSKINNQLYHEEFTLLDDIRTLDDYNNALTSALYGMLINTGKTSVDKYSEIVRSRYDSQLKIISRALDTSKSDSIYNNNLVAFKKNMDEAKKIRDEQIMPYIQAGKQDLAKQFVFGQHDVLFHNMSDIVEVMIKDAHQKSVDGIELANKQANRTYTLFIIIGIVALCLMVILVLTLYKIIVTPLVEITSIAERISKGDIASIKINDKANKDEVGKLKETFKKMVIWLQSISSAVKKISSGDLTTDIDLLSSDDELGTSFKTMISKLNQLTSEISEVIDFLNNSSSEIASASSQLSSAASETASSITETTSTIEEVKQTSQIANKKASMVSENAKISTELSEVGKRAADEIKDVINQIHNQMVLIAETMMKLNEQSQAVGAIISTVEDLAQQTNLLAVNASIEASKAGEQGRGFSVVAQEVKSLASQSKQATSQVREILTDIQKATSAAVMATELGSKSVEKGVIKTTEASDTILTLVKTVSENSQAATQIAAVSHQQLVGMEQATVAMESINQASIQNVESAGLLKDSVLQIKELGERLTQLIREYKLRKDRN